MSNKNTIGQTAYGKSYEYACLISLQNAVSNIRPVVVISNSSLSVAKSAWDLLPSNIQTTMRLSSEAGVKALIDLEPKINDGTDTLELSLQIDKRGQEGDVRDIIIIRRLLKWEIGVSVKHNHEAVKHSRLSPTIDFGKEWLGLKCSDEYFNEILPIFNQLKLYKDANMLWGEVSDKSSNTYVPVLNAFMRELKRLDDTNPNMVPARLLEYLLGRHDFYKLISNESNQNTKIQCFNLHGTLTTASSSKPPLTKVKTVAMPTSIYYLDFKKRNGISSTNTAELSMDNGWSVTFRIHSASSKVENSLKFDIQLEGVPASLYTHTVGWHA